MVAIYVPPHRRNPQAQGAPQAQLPQSQLELQIHREDLHRRYKNLEIPTLLSLFPSGARYSNWPKRSVKTGFMIEFLDIPDKVKDAAKPDLQRVIELRREALPLWPGDPDGSRRHLDWIEILEFILHILKTARRWEDSEERLNSIDSARPGDPFTPPSSPSRKTRVTAPTPHVTAPAPHATAPTPHAISTDLVIRTGPAAAGWIDVDLDVFVLQMAHWRRTLADIWQMVIDDPTQLSVADICLGCAVRYFISEIESAMRGSPEWFENGSFRPAILEHMKATQVHEIVNDLSGVLDSLKGKTIESVQDDLRSMDFGPVKDIKEIPGLRVEGEWICADRARHRNPLYDWVQDIIKETAADPASTTTSVEFILAWLFISDSKKQSRDHLKAIRRAAIVRMQDAMRMARAFRNFMTRGPDGKGSKGDDLKNTNAVYNEMTERIQYINKWAMQQTDIPSIAVAYSWAEYMLILGNVWAFELHSLKLAAYLFDANMILRRWKQMMSSSSSERFCNRYSQDLYPFGAGRPSNERLWKSSAKRWWEDTLATVSDPNRVINKMKDYSILDKYGKSWTVIALVDQTLEVTRDQFVPQGSDQWWQRIKAQAAVELHVKSLSEMYDKVDGTGDIKDKLEAFGALLGSKNWNRDRKKLEASLDKLQIGQDWFPADLM
ncbi:hypothetical protein F5Y10DRAFT_293778 [Nemania abortiva]|nr:hypothetical protein F5Y10DRAFT_293778 [Nemania abortiva]